MSKEEKQKLIVEGFDDEVCIFTHNYCGSGMNFCVVRLAFVDEGAKAHVNILTLLHSHPHALLLQSTSLFANRHISNEDVPTTTISIDQANATSTTITTIGRSTTNRRTTETTAFSQQIPRDVNLLIGTNSSYGMQQEDQISAISADIKLTQQEGDAVRNEEGGDTNYFYEATIARNLQSDQDRKRIERNKRERILSKQRREQRNEENRLMTEKIRKLQFSNDEIKAKIDALFKELSTLLPPERLKEVKEALSKHNFTTNDEISSSLINDNEELQRKINTISGELSSFLPTSEEDEEQEDEGEEQSMQSKAVGTRCS